MPRNISALGRSVARTKESEIPNNEKNTVVITGTPEKIRRFIDEALIDYPLDERENRDEFPAKIIDFTRIIPRPEELDNTVSPVEIVSTQLEADVKNTEYNARSNPLHFGDEGQIRYISRAERHRRMSEYGALTWHDWSILNWGTKWGAYSHTHYALRYFQKYGKSNDVYARVDLVFDTAWTQPTPIFEKIEERWGVEVHAVTQDGGGAPDVEYGDPYSEGYITKTVLFEFDSYEKEVGEPTLAD